MDESQRTKALAWNNAGKFSFWMQKPEKYFNTSVRYSKNKKVYQRMMFEPTSTEKALSTEAWTVFQLLAQNCLCSVYLMTSLAIQSILPATLSDSCSTTTWERQQKAVTVPAELWILTGLLEATEQHVWKCKAFSKWKQWHSYDFFNKVCLSHRKKLTYESSQLFQRRAVIRTIYSDLSLA